MIMQYWCCPAPKPVDTTKYSHYCGSCGCKYVSEPRPTRPGVDHNCHGCGSSRIIKYQNA